MVLTVAGCKTPDDTARALFASMEAICAADPASCGSIATLRGPNGPAALRDLTRSAEARKRACDVTDDLRRMAKPCQ